MNAAEHATVALFSYGTLQLEEVQRATYGRLLCAARGDAGIRRLGLRLRRARRLSVPAAAPLYRFRPVGEADLPLLARWRATPQVAAWWGPPEVEAAAEALADPRIAMWIVAYEGRPFAYAQDYAPHDWDDHPFAHLPAGARGIDQYIGEPDMLDRGHGSAFIRAH